MPQGLQRYGLVNKVSWHAHEWLCTGDTQLTTHLREDFLDFWPWRWNYYQLAIHRKLFIIPSGGTSHQTWICNGTAMRNSHLACTSLSVATRRRFSPFSPFNQNVSYAKTLFREQPMWKHKPQISWNSVSVCNCIFDKWMSYHIYVQIIQGACHTKMLVTPVLWNTVTFTLLLPFWRITEFIAITVVGVECELIPAEPVTVNPC
jgi:hypothetical protein